MSEDRWNQSNLASEAEVPPCIVCNKATLSRARVKFDDRVVEVAICATCIALADRFRTGGVVRSWPLWLPGIAIQSAVTCGLDDWDNPAADDFEGRTLSIHWGRFAVELFVGRRA